MKKNMPLQLWVVAVDQPTGEPQTQNPAKENWPDKQDILTRLHISSRTLQRWRTKGIIIFTCIGGKIYYPESKLEMALHKGINKTLSFMTMLMLLPDDLICV